MLTAKIRLFAIAWFRSHAAFWTITRWTLVVWGVLNGLGVGLMRAKGRISRRVPRVSGSLSG